MKLEIITETGEYGSDSRVTYKIEGLKSISIGEGEPEDMYLFRSLNSIYNLPDFIKAAYNAGKEGEPLVIVETVEDYE